MQSTHLRAAAGFVVDYFDFPRPGSEGSYGYVVTRLAPAQKRRRRADLACDERVNRIGMNR